MLEAEREERIEGDVNLQNAIDNEATARELEDAKLWEAISGTSGGTEELWEALNQEIEERKDNDIDTEEEYVIKVSEGLTLKLKNGTPIEIAFDGNYGEF